MHEMNGYWMEKRLSITMASLFKKNLKKRHTFLVKFAGEILLKEEILR